MNLENIITSMDIGSHRIRTIIGSFEKENNSNFVVLGAGNVVSVAMRKGNILDMESFMDNLDKSLLEAEKMSGEEVKGVYLSFNSSSMDVVMNRGFVAISGEVISPEDVDRVLDVAKSGINLPNKEIIKVIPEYFIVDLEEGVKNPIGLSARKLEVIAHIFTMNSNILSNIKKAVGEIGIEVLDIYPSVLSIAESILTKRQRELGVVCIDIGATTTGITVYEEGTLKHAAIIPIGGSNVTNDIALGVRVSIDLAEKLKIEHSEILGEDSKNLEKEINLKKISDSEEGTVTMGYLSDIVTARYEEILHYVKEELKHIGKDGMLPEGAILVGGGAKEKGLIDLAKETLKLPVFIGMPATNDDLVDATVNDPAFASVIGNMKLAHRYGEEHHRFSINFKGFFSSIMKVLKKIMP